MITYSFNLKFRSVLNTAIIAFTTLLMFNSCEKVKETLTANINAGSETIELEIPIISTEGTQATEAKEVYINIDSFIQASGYGSTFDHIKKISIKSCEIEIEKNDTYPDDNLSVFKDLKADIKSDVKQDWTTMGTFDGTKGELYSSEAKINSEVNLQDYFTSKLISYRIVGTATRTTNAPMKAKVKVKYIVAIGLK